MAIKITLKNSVVQDSVPTTTHLAAVGELALNANINSLGIYMRASDNSIVKMAGPGSVTTPAASVTVAGIAELATSAETTTGTDTARVCTPAGVKAVTDAERTTSNSTYLALAGGTLTGVVAATAGSNSAPAIHFGDSDSGIYGGTNTVSLAAGGTQGLSLDSSAEVEIPTKLTINGAGKTSPLNVRGMTDGNLHIRAITDIHSGTGIGIDVLNNANNAIKDLAIRAATTVFKNASSESARLDSSGRLIIGTSSSRAIAGSTARRLQIEGTAGESAISVVRNSSNTSSGSINFGKSRSSSVGGNTIVQSGDVLGAITFAGADGTDIQTKATEIKGEVDGTPGANDMPGRLVFGTTADGAASPTTRLTIDSAGVVNVPDNGKFTAGASNDLQLYHNGTNAHINHVTSGNMYIDSVGNHNFRNTAGTEYRAKFANNGAVELYYDGVKRLETLSDGVMISGLTRSTNNWVCNDNVKYCAGDSHDLQIYHDATFNRIASDVRTDFIKITSSEHLAKFIPDGAVELFYDNAKKAETYAYGFYMQDIAKVQGVAGGNATVLLYADNALHNADHWKIASEHVGNGFTIQSYASGGWQTVFKGTDARTAELHYQGSKRFETTSSGIQVTGPDNDYASIDLFSDLGTHDSDKFRLHVDDGGPFHIRNKTSGSWENNLAAIGNGSLYLYYDNSKKFETDADGVQVTGFLQAHGYFSDSDFTAHNWHVLQSNDNGHACTIIEHSGDNDPYGLIIAFTDDNPDDNSNYFINCYDTTNTRFRVYSDGDVVNNDNSYGSTSDVKLKENIVDAGSQWNDIKAVKVRNFNFKADTPSDKRIGVIAQELETVSPGLVSNNPDLDKDNNDLGTTTKSVKYSILYMKAIKALQEAMARIEVLETKVAALEGA